MTNISPGFQYRKDHWWVILKQWWKAAHTSSNLTFLDMTFSRCSSPRSTTTTPNSSKFVSHRSHMSSYIENSGLIAYLCFEKEKRFSIYEMIY